MSSSFSLKFMFKFVYIPCKRWTLCIFLFFFKKKWIHEKSAISLNVPRVKRYTKSQCVHVRSIYIDKTDHMAVDARAIFNWIISSAIAIFIRIQAEQLLIYRLFFNFLLISHLFVLPIYFWQILKKSSTKN